MLVRFPVADAPVSTAQRHFDPQIVRIRVMAGAGGVVKPGGEITAWAFDGYAQKLDLFSVNIDFSDLLVDFENWMEIPGIVRGGIRVDKPRSPELRNRPRRERSIAH